MGLLQRAREIREQSDPFAFDQEAGISREDQKDILAQIDQVAQENRIRVNPEVFAFRSRKRGFLFPLTVNLLAAISLAGGIYLLYHFFQQDESTVSGTRNTLVSAEGKLLRELKRQADARIAEKEQEIASIQARLEEIDKEREALESGMEERLALRESELRRTLEQELAAERERLLGQGLSETEVQRRMAEFEAAKEKELQDKVAGFRRELEAERRRQEETLVALRADFTRNLEQANVERDGLLEDARKREQELRRQLDEQAAALTARQEEAGRQLNRAEEEIRRLTEQRRQGELVNGQIQGYYAEIRKDIGERDFREAISDLDRFRTYLQDPAVGMLPEVERRREADIFVIDTLERLARQELEQQSADVSSITASFDLLSRLRETVGRAAMMVRGGFPEEARLLYSEALGMIPEVSESHTYILDRISAAERARARLLEERVANALTASGSGDYEGAIDWYRQALEYLPDNPELREQLLAGIRGAGLSLGLRQIQAEESRAATEVLARADAAMRRGEFPRAADLYVEVIRDFPRSNQMQAASDGLRRAVESGSAAVYRQQEEERSQRFFRALQTANAEFDARNFEASLRSYAAALAYLPADETVRRDLVARIQNAGIQLAMVREQRTQSVEAAAVLARADGMLAEGLRTEAVDEYLSLLQRYPESDQTRDALQRIRTAFAAGNAPNGDEERLAALEREKAALAQEVEDLRTEVAQLREQLAEAAAQPQFDPVAQETLDRLQRIAANYERLKDAYRGYASREDMALTQQGEQGLVEAKRHLDGFLASGEAGDAMPDFLERIKRYDRAFETYGREAALEDVTDVMFQLTSFGSRDEQLRFLDRTIADYRSESRVMAELLGEVKDLIRE